MALDMDILSGYGSNIGPLQSNAINAQGAVPQVNTGMTPTITSPGYTPIGTPGAPGVPGLGGSNFFGKGGGAQLALGAVQTLSSLWNSFQQQKLAKQSLKLQSRAFESNLANTTKSYNTALEDRVRARYHTEGKTSQQADGYVAKHKL